MNLNPLSLARGGYFTTAGAGSAFRPVHFCQRRVEQQRLILGCESSLRALSVRIYHRDLVYSAARQIEPPIGCCHHITHHTTSGWD